MYLDVIFTILRYKKWQKKLLLIQQLFKVDYGNAVRLMAKFVYP